MILSASVGGHSWMLVKVPWCSRCSPMFPGVHCVLDNLWCSRNKRRIFEGWVPPISSLLHSDSISVTSPVHSLRNFWRCCQNVGNLQNLVSRFSFKILWCWGFNSESEVHTVVTITFPRDVIMCLEWNHVTSMDSSLTRSHSTPSCFR